MSLVPVTMTQLLKNPHSIQEMIKQGQNLAVFSRSKLVFEIHPPTTQKPRKNSTKKSKPQAKKFELPTVYFPIKGSLSRKEIYSENSWLDREED